MICRNSATGICPPRNNKNRLKLTLKVIKTKLKVNVFRMWTEITRDALETNWNVTKLKRKNSREKAKHPTLQSSFNWLRVRLKLVVETVHLSPEDEHKLTYVLHTRNTSCCKRTHHVHGEIKHSSRDTGCSLASHFWNMPFPQSSPSTLAAFPPAPPFLSPPSLSLQWFSLLSGFISNKPILRESGLWRRR